LPSDLKISTLLARRWGASFRLRKAWQWLKWHTCDRSWIHVEYLHAMRIANFAFPAWIYRFMFFRYDHIFFHWRPASQAHFSICFPCCPAFFQRRWKT
jgi:hypothetical protein